jgi:hypothetical protein
MVFLGYRSIAVAAFVVTVESLGAGRAWAATTTVGFTVRVSNGVPAVPPGSLLTGSYSYDSATLDSDPAGDIGEYVLQEMRVSLPGGQTVVLGAAALMDIYIADPVIVLVQASDKADFSGTEADFTIDYSGVQPPLAFSPDGIHPPLVVPSAAPPVDNLTVSPDFTMSFPSGGLLSGYLTSTYVVPEPDRVVILGALASLLGLRRIRRAG